MAEQHGIGSSRAYALVNLALTHQQAGHGPLALAYAQRARDEPAAELAVLLSADAVAVRVAIAGGALERASQALTTLAQRARSTGLHAALLEAVSCHASLLAAQGWRDAALARLAYLVAHAQQPAMARDDAQQALQRLLPQPQELQRAEAAACGFELELLIEQALDGALP